MFFYGAQIHGPDDGRFEVFRKISGELQIDGHFRESFYPGIKVTGHGHKHAGGIHIARMAELNGIDARAGNNR